jgi:hypothetical protein
MEIEYKYIRREFLNDADLVHTSWILAHVESSFNGKYGTGENIVYIADCYRRIRLEFFLGRPEARAQSIRKLTVLLDVLVQFKKALLKEMRLIEKAEAEKENDNADEDNE